MNKAHSICTLTPSSHQHNALGKLRSLREPDLTILETALVHGFRKLPDDDMRVHVLGLLERATFARIAKTHELPKR